jgi:adenine-specific DNA methylase
MPQAKKLIEVALPIKEISAESVRDKSIRHGHISTLHLWWARRPLPVCRGVVFASLVPDPEDENCPQAFRDAVDLLLGSKNNLDYYEPYDDIPYTVAYDPMDDTKRNRLLMFIGKFSNKFIENEKKGKSTPSRDKLSAQSLITWDNKNNEKILQKARKLIWVAHNAEKHPDKSAEALLADFDVHWQAIKKAEKELYDTEDRHIESPTVKAKEEKVNRAIKAFLNNMPKVFDPFAGGGAIPLEAARLGCRSYGNDLNPVAHIIQRGSLEFPQKFGKPMRYSKKAFIEKYGHKAFEELPRSAQVFEGGDVIGVQIENRLSYDVEYYANKILARAEEEIGHFYPKGEDNNETIAYYWARVATCSNPSCGAEVPLLKRFSLCKKKNKKIHLKPIINGTDIQFGIKEGKDEEKGWMSSRSLTCPCCNGSTPVSDIKKESKEKGLKQRLVAVITDGENGKEYRLPNEIEYSISSKAKELINDDYVPNERMLKIPDLVSGRGWGVDRWGDLFSDRQLLAMQTFVQKLEELKQELRSDQNEYGKAVATYMAILIDRIAPILTSYGRWDTSRENVQTPFSRQAIPFIFDFPEANPFGSTTGSLLNQLDWIIRYIDSESETFIPSICNNSSSGDKSQFQEKELDGVITDPPYYDAIAYADLSDFFYVWLKRTLPELYPLTLATPQTPKTEECTALKHHHENDEDKARSHFENKLRDIFKTIETQTNGVVSIMFAHQSTAAWTTLCNSIVGADMNITGSWAIDTELSNRMLAMGNAALESSVTVACRPTEKSGIGDYKEIREEIIETVSNEVKLLYQMGFRGADLLTACFGQAVSVFGQYEHVEKADGSSVEVEELLTMAREAAYNAIISDIDADDETRFYIGWLNLFGFTDAEHDDVNRITQVGLNLDLKELINKTILIRSNSTQTLATASERSKAHKTLGESEGSPLIDKVHRAMVLFNKPNRQPLLEHIGEFANTDHVPFWKVLDSLAEVLPGGEKDHKTVMELLANKESLISDSKRVQSEKEAQQDMFGRDGN